MGAMTNAMGSIGGAINKVGKGAVGGARQVGGQIGVPGMKPPGVPGQPGLAGGGAVTGAIGAAQQGQAGVGPGVGQGPAGGKAVFGEQGETAKIPSGEGGFGGGGVIGPGRVQPGQFEQTGQVGGTSAPPPFLQGGLPGLGGMKRNLMQNSAQLTAQGALGKQPAQTTMQKMMSGGLGGGFGRAMRQPQMQQALQQAQQNPQVQQAMQGIRAPDERFPVDPRMQF